MTLQMTNLVGTHRLWFKVVSIVLVTSFLSLVSVPAGLGATTAQQDKSPSGAGIQAASWLVTIPYGAVKVGVALVGAVFGGFTYALSGGDLKSAQSVWTTTMYGTYIITPEHLKGEKPVHFLVLDTHESEAKT